MQVMCLNGWGGKLLDALLPYLEETRPDVLCLQEVIHSPETEKDWLIYRDGDHVLPQRANFFREVCLALPDHVAMFCPAAQGVLWDGDRAVPSRWGLASFVHKSRPVIGQVQGFVHKEYSAVGYGDHPRSRSLHGVRVFDYDLNRAVSITHMHGLRDPGGKHDTPERFAQAQRLLEHAQRLVGADDLSVICGEFNVGPDSQTLTLLQEAGLSEIVTERGFPGTRNTQYEKPGRFADYMLVSDTAAVRDFEVIYIP